MTYLRYSTRNVPYQRHCNFSDFASAHGQGDCALAERDPYFSTSHRARRLQRLSRMSRSRLRTMLELLHSHEPSKHAVLCRYPHLSLQDPVRSFTTCCSITKTESFPSGRSNPASELRRFSPIFSAIHGNRIEEATGRSWDVITTVPSSQDRVGEHPLVRSLSRVRGLADQYQQLLVKGDTPVDHLNASDDGYRSARGASG